jgi:hypothetical protein
MILGWVSFPAYPNIFGVNGIVVFVVVSFRPVSGNDTSPVQLWAIFQYKVQQPLKLA